MMASRYYLRKSTKPTCYARVLHSRRKDKESWRSSKNMFKNKVHVELSKRWIDYSTDNDNSNNSDLFTQKGREYLRSLKISSVKDCLDTIDFLVTKLSNIDSRFALLFSMMPFGVDVLGTLNEKIKQLTEADKYFEDIVPPEWLNFQMNLHSKFPKRLIKIFF